MHTVTRKRLSTLIYCLVAINLVLSPVAHASMIMFSETDNHTVSFDHDCHSEKAELADGMPDMHQHDDHPNNDTNCENGMTCKLLCSISVSALYAGESFGYGFDSSNRWHLKNSSSLKSSFLSRLERPPRL